MGRCSFTGLDNLSRRSAPGKRALGRQTRTPIERGDPLEAQLYRRVNAVLEPAIRAGLGAPLLAPAGLVVVEMTGRKSGRMRRVPLAALRCGPYLMIGTVRGARSLWVRNLAANGDVRVWLAARARPMRAFVLRPRGSARTPRALPPALRSLWGALAPLGASGFAFALLAPAPKRAASRRAPASPRATRSRSR